MENSTVGLTLLPGGRVVPLSGEQNQVALERYRPRDRDERREVAVVLAWCEPEGGRDPGVLQARVDNRAVGKLDHRTSQQYAAQVDEILDRGELPACAAELRWTAHGVVAELKLPRISGARAADDAAPDGTAVVAAGAPTPGRTAAGANGAAGAAPDPVTALLPVGRSDRGARAEPADRPRTPTAAAPLPGPQPPAGRPSPAGRPGSGALPTSRRTTGPQDAAPPAPRPNPDARNGDRAGARPGSSPDSEATALHTRVGADPRSTAVHTTPEQRTAAAKRAPDVAVPAPRTPPDALPPGPTSGDPAWTPPPLDTFPAVSVDWSEGEPAPHPRRARPWWIGAGVAAVLLTAGLINRTVIDEPQTLPQAAPPAALTTAPATPTTSTTSPSAAATSSGRATATSTTPRATRTSTTTPTRRPTATRATTVAYQSCAAARAAGAAPLTLGEPGYSIALDPDNDGVACD